MIEALLRRVATRYGLAVVKRGDEPLVYIHDYAGGYDEYRSVQTAANKRKLSHVWADAVTLGAVAADLGRRFPAGVRSGICHGARNGFEVAWFREALDADVIGTDISETATQFADMVVWDFHDANPDWSGRFDFVYTNSLDQAVAPQRALAAWAAQLVPAGRIYIEHTASHGVDGAGEMDPFGAHPMVMPYLFFKWGRGTYALDDILEVEAKANKKLRAWIFVLRSEPAAQSGGD